MLAPQEHWEGLDEVGSAELRLLKRLIYVFLVSKVEHSFTAVKACHVSEARGGQLLPDETRSTAEVKHPGSLGDEVKLCCHF